MLSNFAFPPRSFHMDLRVHIQFFSDVATLEWTKSRCAELRFPDVLQIRAIYYKQNSFVPLLD